MTRYGPDEYSIYALYQKHRVDSKTIRVVDLLPVPILGNDDAPVRCKVRVVELASDPKFTALSYAGGGDRRPGSESVICDGRILVGVPSNCYMALKNLHKKAGRKLTIWVDAICVDKTSIRDKERQIPLMGEIYSRAETVFIWLGDSTPGKNRAMGYMGRNPTREFFTFKRESASSILLDILRVCLGDWNRPTRSFPRQIEGKQIYYPPYQEIRCCFC